MEVISFIDNYANPEGEFSGILCVHSVITAIVLKQRSMNKLDQLISMDRAVVDSGNPGVISRYQPRSVTTRPSISWGVSEAAMTTEILTVWIRSLTRDQGKLESRPLT